MRSRIKKPMGVSERSLDAAQRNQGFHSPKQRLSTLPTPETVQFSHNQPL